MHLSWVRGTSGYGASEFGKRVDECGIDVNYYGVSSHNASGFRMNLLSLSLHHKTDRS